MSVPLRVVDHVVLENVPLLGPMWHNTKTGKRWPAGPLELVAMEPCNGLGGDACACVPCAARREVMREAAEMRNRDAWASVWRELDGRTA